MRFERRHVARLATKRDIAVGPHEQQPIVIACAITRGERRARRNAAQLEHGSEPLRERRKARFQRGLPLLARRQREQRERRVPSQLEQSAPFRELDVGGRSEEHTSELQSQSNLVCRLLLEKKKKKI